MYRILPPPTVEIDPDWAYREQERRGPRRPWVMMNMIASADGAIDWEGASGPLGSAGDKDVFGAIRSLPDVILVGSTTATVEDYGPPSTSVSTRTRRLEAGAWPVARGAVVSNSLSLDPGARLFGSRSNRPIIITSEASPADRRGLLAEHADVVVAGGDRVDMAAAMDVLADLGARTVLSEGGPALNAQLIAAGLVDEVFLSVAPMLLAGESRRIAYGTGVDTPVDLELVQVLTEDHYLFLRYLVVR
ncbi:MAG TPA: pyrimidine reductase family protein [Acidimicrobiales bacterium]|nr:pyrimidine reductase family protein [Acidimicrobiales bacterium]